mmetsp:Transcript_29559/g.81158  ORF Transcript_29559/g.81158 Transcript_29559/m.81158 type:complete len:339 (-) Transcript_29559:516-1532(-)
MGDAPRVQVRERRRDHRRVEARRRIVKPADDAQLCEELSAHGHLEHHVDLALAVEGRHHAQDERVVARLQHPLLVDHVLDLLVAHQLTLVEALERVRRLVRLVQHQLHAAKRALSEHRDHLQVVPSHLGLLLPLNLAVTLHPCLLEDVRERAQRLVELLLAELHQLGAAQRLHGRVGRLRREEGALSEVVAVLELLDLGAVVLDRHRAALDDEKMGAHRPLLDGRGALLEDGDLEDVEQRLALRHLQRLEQVHPVEDLPVEVFHKHLLERAEDLLEVLPLELADAHGADGDDVGLPLAVLRRLLQRRLAEELALLQPHLVLPAALAVADDLSRKDEEE